MYDNVKDEIFSGQQYLEIMKQHMATETSPDILLDNCRSNIAACISAYIPEARSDYESEQVFNLYIDQIVPNLAEEEAKLVLVFISIHFTTSEAQFKLLKSWFDSGIITNTKGEAYPGLELKLKAKHAVVQKIFSSLFFSREEKDQLLAKLAEQDSSDWTANTKHFCRSVLPDAAVKEACWNEIFSDDNQMSLE